MTEARRLVAVAIGAFWVMRFVVKPSCQVQDVVNIQFGDECPVERCRNGYVLWHTAKQRRPSRLLLQTSTFIGHKPFSD